MKDLTPSEIVVELDRYIVGQKEAKRSVAVALRNRWRRRQVSEELRDEIYPKNIIMIGSTGVGKTEVARRLAKLASAPFLKVEATKFTEVGYVGKDVESMVRDLTEISVNMVREQELKKVKKKARENARERVLDLLLPESKPSPVQSPYLPVNEKNTDSAKSETRDKMRAMLESGELDERFVQVQAKERNAPMVEVLAATGLEEMDLNLRDMMNNMMPRSGSNKKRVRVPEALEFLEEEEAQKLIDEDKVITEAKERVEQSGIIFLDEIDKIIGEGYGGKQGPEVSRSGVQRDILPIVEGSNVKTKYGMVRTDHVLFIAAGAFHGTKPSDLIPELQGRFPIRVELHALTEEDFVRILSEPTNSLVRQYTEIFKTEQVDVDIVDSAIEKIAEIAAAVNEKTEDIGARRLYTVMEKVFDDISFHAPEMTGQHITIDADYVEKQLGNIVEDKDLSRYIL